YLWVGTGRNQPCVVGSPLEFIRFIDATLFFIDNCKIDKRIRHAAMIWAEGYLPGYQRALEKIFGFSVFTLRSVYDPQITEGLCDIAVTCAKSFFSDRKCTLEKVLCFSVFALLAIHLAQAIDAVSYILMVLPQRFFSDRQCTLVRRFCLAKF